MKNTPHKQAPIVVLEGSYPMRFRVQKFLQTHGYEVVTSRSINEFFTPPLVSRHPTDIRAGDACLFIIGQKLPDGMGLEVVKRLKSSDRWRHVPILMLSHEAKTQTVLDALRYGVSDYMLSPIEEEDIVSRVNAILTPMNMVPEENLPTISHNLMDLLAKEISRAKRTQLPMSIMLADFSTVKRGETLQQTTFERVHADWVPMVVDSVRRFYRDIDTIVPFGSGTIIAVLPLAPAESLQLLEDRLKKCTKGLLVRVSANTNDELALFVGSANYPEDGADAETLLRLARERVEKCSQQYLTGNIKTPEIVVETPNVSSWSIEPLPFNPFQENTGFSFGEPFQFPDQQAA